MTIKEAQAWIAIHGENYTVVMDLAYNSKGTELSNHFKLMTKQALKKKAKYPKYFKK